MAKQLNVDLRFTADTSQAKGAITELQAAIQKLGYGSASSSQGVLNPAAFEKASAAARELAMHLNQAMNPKTGNLDLSRLNASLKASGTNLATLTSSFKDAGSTGQAAFTALARSIAMADQPTINVNTHLATMWTTLKNVARFQISSSIMHGLIGGIQSAQHYAQDLNESLNNIRIVTGQSSEQMAKFAKQANTTAKNLNATTLDYTNASLIYYQQGLNDQQVAERTQTTIKLANVSRQSAEEVSNQMTAIWNNFDNGSHSLEYYADVITALGAATASSSSEIAQGLSKFAAVADTVGLSYENATAALATIVATTRQSADTVGTGLRTLFSRLEGLKLGETLEDGVDLNKYSAALNAVGVQVLDASGKLKGMDAILEDLGSKWQDLDNTQRTALAQTVGGVRQYTTMMALMDNWDFFKQNQQIAGGAEGTLQQQADIYAESWEAARDRVKTAIESLYDTLINENFFISIDKMLENLIGGVDKFIENLGGVKAVLAGIAAFTLSAVSSKIGPAVQKVVQDIQIMTGGADKVYTKMQGEFKEAISGELASGKYTTTNAAELESSQALLLAKTKLSAVNNQLTAQERMQNELAMQGFQMQAEEIKKQAIEVEKLEQKQKEINEVKTKADEEKQTAETKANNEAKVLSKLGETADLSKVLDMTYLGSESAQKALIGLRATMIDAFTSGSKEAINLGENVGNIFKNLSVNQGADLSVIQNKQNELRSLQATFQDLFKTTEFGAQNINAAFKKAFEAKDATSFNNALDEIVQKVSQANVPAEQLGQALKQLGINPTAIKNYTQALEELHAAEAKATEAGKNDEKATKELIAAKERLAEAQKQLNIDTANYKPTHTVSPIETIAKGAAGLGQIAMTINAMKSAIQTLGDDSATVGEKITASFMAISMAVPSAIGAFKNLTPLVTGLAQSISGLDFSSMISGFKELDKSKGILQELSNMQSLGKSKQDLEGYFDSVKEGLSEETIATIEAAIADGEWEMAEAALTGAIKAKVLALLGSIAIIALVIAAIAALSLIIYDQVSAYNADAAAAKNTAKAAEELGKKSQEAAQRVQSIKSAFDGYDSAVEKLRSCTKGTQEWNDALQEVNDSVLKLMEDYPDLVGEMDISRDTNGMLTINNKDAIIAKAQGQADAARQAVLMGNVAAAQAQQKANETAIYRKFAEISQTDDTQLNAEAITRNNQRQQIINEASKYGGLTFEEFSKEIGNSIIATKDFYNAIQDLANGANSVAKKMENTANAIAETKLGDKFGIAEKEIASEAYENAYNQIYDSIITEGTKGVNRASGAQNANVKDIWERYNAALGTNYSLSSNPIQGNDENRVFEYLDNGEKKQASLAEIAAAIAAAEALSTLTGSAQAAAEALANIKAPKGTNNEGWNSFAANKDFRDWTGNEINAIREQFSDFAANYNPDDWKGKIKTGNKDQAGNDIMRDAASAEDAFLSTIYGGLGLSGEHVAAFRSGIEDSQSYLETYYADVAKARKANQGQYQDFATRQAYSQALQNSPGAAGLLVLNENQQNAMTQAGISHAVSAFDKAGKAGGITSASLLGNLLNNIDPSELDNIVAQLDKYDVSTWINVDLNDITDLPGLIAALQSEADSNPIEIRAKLDALESAKDDLKEGMSSTEWKDYFAQHGEALGLSDTESQADFMASSYEDQQSYIQGQARHQRTLAANELEDRQNEISELEAEHQQAIDDGDVDRAKEIAQALGEARLEAEMLRADLEDAADAFHPDDFSDDEWESIQRVAKAGMEAAQARADTNEYSEDFADTNSQIIDQLLETSDLTEQQKEALKESLGSYDELTDEAADYQEQAKEANSALANSTEMMEIWATKQARVNRGIKKLQKDYGSISDSLESNAEGSAAWLDSMEELRGIIADITNTKLDKVSKGFAKAAKNSGLLEKAAKGDKKALNQLQKEAQKMKLAQAVAKQVKNAKHSFQDLEKIDSFEKLNQAYKEQMDSMTEQAKQMGVDLPADFQTMFETANELISNTPPGEPLPPDTTAYLEALAMMVYQTTGSLEAVQSMFAGFGATLKITPEVKEIDDNVTTTTTGQHDYLDEHLVYNVEEGNTVTTAKTSTGQVTGFKIEGVADAETPIAPSGGGGGGGGGGSKPKAPKPHKKTDMGKRYHRVKEQIDDRKREQDEAERRKDRAFGAEKLNQLEEEIRLRKEQISLQKEYIDQINGFLKGDREVLVSAMKDVGINIEFDAEGVIKDYQAIEDSLLNQENWLIDIQNQYEQMGADVPIWVELYQRKIDDAREYMDRYEETLNLLEEQMQVTSEQIDELSDALFEVTTTKVELNIGINDDEASRLEYFLTKYEDNAYKAAEAISVFGDQAVNQLKRIGVYQEGINELLASKGLTLADLENLDSSAVQKLIEEGDFTQEQVDALREWRDGLLEANQAMMELRTNIAERVLDTFDQLNEKVGNSYDLFDHYNSILENYKDITDLLGRQINQEQRKLIDDLNNAMLENQKNTTIAAKTRYDDLVEERVRAQALYDTALAEGGEDAAQKYEEILQNIDEALNDAEEQYLEAWQETMDTAQTIFETMLDNIVKDFEDVMSGTFGSMDYLQEAFDRQGELDENYLDDYDKLYELNKLERELNKVLSDTRGVTNRKALLDLQAKINEYQENGVQLSQYDVDALRAKFELQQAYNDLMLARDAKSTVRLSRDNEGNWGYVYTANQDEVEEAEQTYEDKLHEYQKLNDEYIQTLQEKALEVQTTYRDTLREIMEDVTLTDEERDARVKELNDWLMAQQDFFAQQSQNVFDNQSETYDRMLKTYDVAVADLVDSWEETRLAMLTTIENMPDYMQNWQDASNEYLTSLTDALAQRMQVMNDILGIGETSVETFGDHIAGVIEKVGENSDKTVNQVTELAKILNQEFGQAIDGAIAWEEEYAQQMNAAIDANERMVKSVNDLIAALADIPSYNHLHDTLTDFLQLSKDYELGKISKAEFDEANKNLNLELEDFLGFDEGGYTGAWGSGGRLALLHEKENVFNQEDTANLLDAARLLRQIDMSAAYMATGFGNLSSPDIMGNGFVIQQEVHIEASFPDVTDSAEIEEAFNNLENKAAQYANRKNED